MKEEKLKTQRCYLRKRRGVLCVDVVAECDRFVGERWDGGTVFALVVALLRFPKRLMGLGIH
jgi:hypothetical protein